VGPSLFLDEVGLSQKPHGVRTWAPGADTDPEVCFQPEVLATRTDIQLGKIDEEALKLVN
jgi:hypothetical protein